ncbi:unnamed protein product [Arctia plantaginis]|uniref:PPAF-2-like Clip domain-containing protein n=1 Tax=Arctia plantaginis TaxID=874455 RepID=A0A8S1BIX7_ARCPL|nr:unnamed protein product [Arctia plantaginis]
MQIFLLTLLLGFASSEFQQKLLSFPILSRSYRSVSIDPATIEKIFGGSKEIASDVPGAVLVNAEGQKCQCVPYYLCADIASSNSDFVEVLSDEKEQCLEAIEVCCAISKVSTGDI